MSSTNIECSVAVSILKGLTKRASMVKAVAKRAGMSVSNHAVPFTLIAEDSARPGPPLEVTLKERTQTDFVVTWRPPKQKIIERTGRQVTQYAIELSVSGKSGTAGPFREIWRGKGVPYPSFEDVEPAVAAISSKEPGIIASLGVALNSLDSLAKSALRAKTYAPGDDSDEPQSSAPLAYSLEVGPELFGRLRIRCWSDGEKRPSPYSSNVKLTRFVLVGKTDNLNDQAKRREYFKAHGHLPRPRDVAKWGKVQQSKNGQRQKGIQIEAPSKKVTNQATAEASAPAPAAPAMARQADSGASVYDVPVPPPVEGLAAAGDALGAFYEEMGVTSSGIFLGLRIDSVLHAVIAGGMTATLRQPLMCLAETAFADVLLPMVDTVVVMKTEWLFALEKVSGIITKVLTYADSYNLIEEHVRALLLIMVEFYEMMRCVNVTACPCARS